MNSYNAEANSIVEKLTKVIDDCNSEYNIFNSSKQTISKYNSEINSAVKLFYKQSHNTNQTKTTSILFITT